MKKILFLTGTRADFGKIKPLISILNHEKSYDLNVFVTGMHMLSRYGSTWEEVTKFGKAKAHLFFNQRPGDGMDEILSKTISGLADYVREERPDLIVVHGDRVEALAGAAVGTLNNILVCHIEGGELSGTVDEILRHSISKLAHKHFVANHDAKKRLRQMGEIESNVYVIGSPDIDAMESSNLPTLDEALSHYELPKGDYAILIFHPVTTDLENLNTEIEIILDSLERVSMPVIVIESNNDTGSEIIQNAYVKRGSCSNFHFFPSMRFEYFLTILRNAKFMIGNSSAGVREAPHYGVPAVNLGTRQKNRVRSNLVIDTAITKDDIEKSIQKVDLIERVPEKNFGDGQSAKKFAATLSRPDFWDTSVQKQFIDDDTREGNR